MRVRRLCVVVAAMTLAQAALAAAGGGALVHGSPAGAAGVETRTVPPATPIRTNNVYFLGDSVTAGFGYCGTEAASFLPGSSCLPNQPFADSWVPAGFTLATCSPPDPVDDRCSNNNVRGTPWTAGAWQPGTPDNPSPEVSYSFHIARHQHELDRASIRNWAVTGSTPRDWDPHGVATDPAGAQPGRFGLLVDDAENGIAGSYVVMTLGANPLLSDYLRIFGLKAGQCASGTVSGGTVLSPAFVAQALDFEAGGLGECFRRRWDEVKQSEHLENLYLTLLANGNHVLVVGYPLVCPWSFGNWQPTANVRAPSTGASCATLRDEAKGISQLDQARWLGEQANLEIRRIVDRIRDGSVTGKPTGDIAFAEPDPTWLDHQAWNARPYVFKHDTWVHPNRTGHITLANTVLAATCREFGHWCGKVPLRWSAGQAVCIVERAEPSVATTEQGPCGDPFAVEPCLNGGWEYLERADGTVFADQAACDAYTSADGDVSDRADRLGGGGQMQGYEVSADGSRVVFQQARARGEPDELFSVPVGGGPVTTLNGPLTAGGAVSAFAVSPNGSRVVYRADQDTDGVFELYSVPTVGGPAKKLSRLGTRADAGFSFQVSPDSSRVVYVDDVAGRLALFSIAIDGGQPVRLSEPVSGDDAHLFEISPDSTRVVYRTAPASSADELYSVPIGGGQPTRLSDPQVRRLGDVPFTFMTSPDSAHVLYLAGEPNAERLYSVPIAGGPSNPLSAPLENVVDVQVARDSSRVVYNARQGGVYELLAVPLAGGDPTRLDGGPGLYVPLFELSADSTHVAYMANHDHAGTWDAYTVPVGGGTPTKVSTAPEVSYLRWSPDSSTVVYLSWGPGEPPTKESELYAVPVTGGTPTRLTEATAPSPGVGFTYRFSADGSRVVYLANRHPGTGRPFFELYSVRLAGGPSTKLSGPPDPNVAISTWAVAGERVVYRTDACCGEPVSPDVGGPTGSGLFSADVVAR